jgi:hypothetical protein
LTVLLSQISHRTVTNRPQAANRLSILDAATVDFRLNFSRPADVPFTLREPMTSAAEVLSAQNDEALFWLDLAKRVLGGEISPDEALEFLDADGPSVDARGSAN